MRSPESSAPSSRRGDDCLDGRRLVGEGPSVIGMITSVLQSGGSIDTAIREVAEEGPRYSKSLFSDAVGQVDIKEAPNIREGLAKVLKDVPKEAEGYGRAILIALSASESADEETMGHMLRDAADTALESVRTVGESYGASLTVPCTAVFGIGIMVPMILMSILPMLSIGGIFGSVAVDQRFVALLTLVVVPSAILLVCIGVRKGNPYISDTLDLRDSKHALPLLLSVPLAFVYIGIGQGGEKLFLLSLAPACIAAVLLMSDAIHRENKRRISEMSLMDSVFDLGNRMISGSNFETASVESIRTRKGCAGLSDALSREYSLCRGDVSLAVSRTMEPVSKEVSLTLRNILLCSTRDSYDAGRLAISLGKQFQNRRTALRAIETRLKSTTDMMTATAVFFAPMVLGMSVSMLEPLSKIQGFVSFDGASMILSSYLVELCALISMLTSNLGNDGSVSRMVWRFCLMCPVSLVVFTICCSLRSGVVSVIS